jgi:hypothetical protein
MNLDNWLLSDHYYNAITVSFRLLVDWILKDNSDDTDIKKGIMVEGKTMTIFYPEG